MANLKYMGLHTGNDAPHVEVLPITTSVDIKKGTVIALGNTRTLTTTIDANAVAILGTAAEDYKCTKDEFNTLNGSGKIKVNMSGSSVYSMPLPVFTASSTSTAGNLVVNETAYAGIGTKVKGSALIFVGKGANSTSTLEEGDIIGISSGVDASGKLNLSLSESITISEGDKFRFVPFIGFDMLTVSGTNLVVSSGTSRAKVIGNDAEKKNAYVVLSGTYLN